MIRSITIKANNIEGTAATYYDGKDNLEEFFFQSVFGASFSGSGITYVIEKEINSITVNSSSGFSESQVDNIKLQLTTSLEDYDAAPVGSWVMVTETEYNNIFTNLSNTSKKGNTDIQLTTPGYTQSIIIDIDGDIEILEGITEMQFSINNTVSSPLTIDPGEWVIAFATETRDATAVVQFGWDTDFHTGTPTYDGTASIAHNGACYHVRKAPTGDSISPATQTLYPSIKINTNYFSLVPETAGWYTNDSGSTWAPITGGLANGAAKFQMIVTTTKSW